MGKAGGRYVYIVCKIYAYYKCNETTGLCEVTPSKTIPAHERSKALPKLCKRY